VDQPIAGDMNEDRRLVWFLDWLRDLPMLAGLWLLDRAAGPYPQTEADRFRQRRKGRPQRAFRLRHVVVRASHARWPRVDILIRGDSHYGQGLDGRADWRCRRLLTARESASDPTDRILSASRTHRVSANNHLN
jgi:hypothetical protein